MPTLDPAVFLDRDGTLMENVPYCSDPRNVVLLPGVVDGLHRLRDRGFRLVIVTNQSGIGRGFFPVADYEAVHAELLRQIGPWVIDANYFCPDDPEEPTSRRKPAPGMLREAASDHRLDLGRSYLIGDHATDMECARRGGLAGAVLVLTGHGAEQAAQCQSDFTAPTFTAAAEWIIQSAGGFTPLPLRNILPR